MKYFHQYDEKGNHRLGTSRYDQKLPGKESEIKWGEWASYQTPAMLGQKLAVTEYYRGSKEFPNPEVLYQVQSDVWPLSPVEVYKAG